MHNPADLETKPLGDELLVRQRGSLGLMVMPETTQTKMVASLGATTTSGWFCRGAKRSPVPVMLAALMRTARAVGDEALCLTTAAPTSDGGWATFYLAVLMIFAFGFLLGYLCGV